VHEIKSFQGRRQSAGQADGAGIIDKNINPAKSFDRLLHGPLNLFLRSNIHGAGQGFSPGGLHSGGRTMNCPGQFGMRLDGLGGNDNIGALASRAQPSGVADSPAGAGDEQCLAFKVYHAVAGD